MPIGRRSDKKSDRGSRRRDPGRGSDQRCIDGPWRRLGDLLLQRQVLATRVARGGPLELPGPLPSGPEVDRIIESVGDGDPGGPADDEPGGTERRQARINEIRDCFEPAIRAAKQELMAPVSELTIEGSTEHLDLFSIMAANAGLDEAGMVVLALVLTVEVDTAHHRLLSWLQDDPGQRRLGLGLLSDLVGAEGVTAAAPSGRLVRAGYLAVDTDGPWAARTVGATDGVLWALAGTTGPDPDLPVGVESHLSDVPGEPGANLVLAHGADRRRRREAATDLAAGHRFLVSPVPATDTGWQAVVREATMRGCGIVIEVDGPLEPAARRRLEETDHLTWVVSSLLQLPLDCVPHRPWRELEVEPTPADPERWAVLLPGTEVGRHPLNTDQLHEVVRAYPAVGEDLDAAVRRLAGGTIDRLARRRRPRRSWDDLVVPTARRHQLAEVVSRYRHRATVHDTWGYDLGQAHGVVALFHGPSGTGKTLSAEIIANDLGLDLFSIDLSAMVSKYIGETEKNLEQVFHAASAANVVLLFDEADSLFGKRSEVSEAKDRYANIEVSYLLQRIEAYDGIAVLTTNLLNNIDQAFLRRIDVLVEFDMPAEEERLALWRLGFPTEAPLDGVDLERLAERFKLPGGSIHSVALGAAFLAADAAGPIRTEHVMEALGREYTKLGRLRTEEEFGSWLEVAT